MGVIGILLLAKRRKLIPLVQPLLDALREQAGFWLAQDLYDRAIREAEEQP